MLIPLFIVLCLAIYFLNPDERVRLLRGIVSRLHQAQNGAQRLRGPREPLHDTLHARTPVALATPALVVLHVTVFVAMLLGPAPIADPDTLVAFGANYAPRTTNGEWGRLVTSIFVQPGPLALIVNVAALVSVGLLLERLVGPLTFLVVYMGAGVLSGLVSLSTSLALVTAGSSGAVFGLYGLLIALWAHGAVQRADTTVRLPTVKRIAPAAMVFTLYSLMTGSIDSSAECGGLVTGFVAGLVLGRWVRDGRPPARKVAVTMATAAVIAVISAIPLRGVADVRPVLAQVVEVEARIAKEYDAAVERFTKGRLSARALAAVIEEQVTPQLQGTEQLLRTLNKVPVEHQALVAAADTYLRLRQESWQIRARALRKGNSAMLRDAENAERASLDALAMIRRGA